MRWLQNISFSSPSSSSSSPVSSHHSSSSSSAHSSRHRNDVTKTHFNYSTHNSNNQQSNNNNYSNHHRQQNRDKRGPRLTRQKKLRHLSDQHMVGAVNCPRAESLNSVILSRSNSNYDQSSASSTFKSSTGIAQPCPLPLPLPVPEETGELRLLSPREAAANGRGGEERERDLFRDRVDGAGDGISSPLARLFSSLFLFFGLIFLVN